MKESAKGRLFEKKKIIDTAIDKAKTIPRDQALKCKFRTTTNRPGYKVSFDPRLPSIPKLTRKFLKMCFQKPNDCLKKTKKRSKKLLLKVNWPQRDKEQKRNL